MRSPRPGSGWRGHPTGDKIPRREMSVKRGDEEGEEDESRSPRPGLRIPLHLM